MIIFELTNADHYLTKPEITCNALYGNVQMELSRGEKCIPGTSDEQPRGSVPDLLLVLIESEVCLFEFIRFFWLLDLLLWLGHCGRGIALSILCI